MLYYTIMSNYLNTLLVIITLFVSSCSNNNDKLSEAKLILEKTVEKHKGDQVISQALITLKEISIETGTVDLFTDWLKKQQINSEDDIQKNDIDSAGHFF